MDTRAAIRANINLAQMVSDSYLQDLTDDEMMYRPHPVCNHVKWQLGHLIVSEHEIIEKSVPGSMPPLPDGFEDPYSKENALSDDPSIFHSKSELLSVCEIQRAATLNALQQMSDDDLDNPTPDDLKEYAPTVGEAFSMQGGHWLMHAGQWAVIRRQLGRPPLF